MIHPGDIIRNLDHSDASDLEGSNACYILGKVIGVDGNLVRFEVLVRIWCGEARTEETGRTFTTRLHKYGRTRLGEGLQIISTQEHTA